MVWMTEEAPGEWGIAELGADAVVDRIRPPVVGPQTRAELKLLLRASLPDCDRISRFPARSRMAGDRPPPARKVKHSCVWWKLIGIACPIGSGQEVAI